MYGFTPYTVWLGRSRYIDAGTDTQGDTTYKMHEHYMFIEAEHNPEQAPVFLWSNGGKHLNLPRRTCAPAAVLPAQGAWPSS